jgi:hypothetical protein
MDDKNYTRQIPVIIGKNEIHKSNFSYMNFLRGPPQIARTKNVSLFTHIAVPVLGRSIIFLFALNVF